MAIPKNEATRTFTAECKSEFELLERKIDEEIRLNYVGHGMTIYLDKLPNGKVRTARIEVYRKAGWEISFHDNQQEGASVALR